MINHPGAIRGIGMDCNGRNDIAKQTDAVYNVFDGKSFRVHEGEEYAVDETVNENLLNEQKYWATHVLGQYITDKNPCLLYDGECKKRHGEKLSHPFYMGLSDEYIHCQGKKRVMIVGQEARGFGEIDDGTAHYEFLGSQEVKPSSEQTNEPTYSQRWAIAYYENQVHGKDSIDFKIDPNPCPFWSLFRAIENGGFVPCWNNLDKVYFGDLYRDGDEQKSLSEPAEVALSRQYARNGDSTPKSLLQREIELAQPDIVLFVTGPNYAKSMEIAFGVSGQLNGRLNKDKKILKITDTLSIGRPAFWTYHPANRLGIQSAKLFLDLFR